MGLFQDYDIVMHADREDWTDAVIEARVRTASVFMPNKRMQSHIQHPEYFHTEQYPDIVFNSKKMEKVANDRFRLHGNLEIAGTAVEKTLDVQFNGYAYPGEKSICGWQVDGFVTHEEFGWDTGGTLHSGKAMLGDTIWFTAHLRME